MRRLIVVAGFATAVVSIASVAVIAWITRAPDLSAPSPTVQEPVAPMAAPASVAEVPVTAPQASAPPPQATVVPGTGSDFTPAAKAERQSIAQAIRRPPHRVVRGTAAPVDLFRGLEALKAQIRRCAGARDPAGSAASAEPTVLLLEFESLEGRVAILNAAVRSRGGATDRTIACAQQELLGREIPVAMAEPGPHFELPFTLRL